MMGKLVENMTPEKFAEAAKHFTRTSSLIYEVWWKPA